MKHDDCSRDYEASLQVCVFVKTHFDSSRLRGCSFFTLSANDRKQIMLCYIRKDALRYMYTVYDLAYQISQ